MKYLHIVQFHLPSGGGVGSMLTDLCEAMIRKGAETYIIELFQRKGISYEEKQAWAKEKGVNLVLLQKDLTEPRWKSLFRLRRLIRSLSLKDKCCLFLHLKWGVLAGIVSTLGLCQIRRVEVYHSGYSGYKLQSFLSKPFIDHYIAVSKDAARQLKEWFHIQEGRVSVVYNGVDVSSIRKHVKSIRNLDDSLFRFKSVGRLSPEKGFTTAIKAYSALRGNGVLNDTSYTMIGDGTQKEECIRLGKGFVSFLGLMNRESVYKEIEESDVMVLPSLWEGNSILMLETIVLGKPMILTDIPAFREVLGFTPLHEREFCRKEWFGLVFRAEDVQACADAFLMMDQSKEEFEPISNKLQLLAESFTTERQAEKYLSIANKCFSAIK